MSRPSDEHAAADAGDTQRIDKWLWFARLIKSRTLAAELVTAGKVRVNRNRLDKPSQPVRIGDVLTVTLNRRVRLVEVAGLGVRRGPSAAALSLYRELTAPADAPKPLAPTQGLPLSKTGPGRRPPGSGRPTKKERRDIDRLNAKRR